MCRFAINVASGTTTIGLGANETTIVACYCRGTLIRTARGETKVEELEIGDEITTASGATRPIKWIGRRSYGGRFVMGRTDILPICIKAGALDDNVPERDLWISPHHAMYFKDDAVGGVLIEAKNLVNGASIVQAERVEKVEYFHIELDSHDVIIAEGALSETFLDDDSRGMFHNVHEYCALAVNPSVPARNTRELIAHGKANPGQLTFGSGSSSARIAGEMLKSLGGFDMLHVPYKSNPMAVTDLLGGQISLMFADISTTLPQIRAGKVRGFGVSGTQRSPLAPDLPTMVEEGVAGYDLTAWFAAFVPAKTPQAIIGKLNAAINSAIADRPVADALLAAGIEPVTGTPDELRAFVVSETKKWAEIVKAAGIAPE
jgi:ABC-type amino acid transport substrate-binding protein